MRDLLLCAKKYQSIQKRHVKSGLVWIRSGLSLDLVWTSSLRLRVKCKDPAIGRVCLVLLTDLIIRVGGKLLCQLFFGFKLFSWCLLGGILGFEGLDKGICWVSCGETVNGLEQTTAKAKCGGPSTAQRTMRPSVASVGMTD